MFCRATRARNALRACALVYAPRVKIIFVTCDTRGAKRLRADRTAVNEVDYLQC